MAEVDGRLAVEKRGRESDGRSSLVSLLWSRDGPWPRMKMKPTKQDQDTNTAAAATTTSNKSPSLWIDGVSYAEGIAGW